MTAFIPVYRPGAESARAKSSDVVPVVIFLVSRVLLAALARWAPQLLTPLHRYRIFLPHSDPLARAWDWTSPWFRFDARWYIEIAQHGYHWGQLGVANTNFMPVYPLLIRLLQPVTLGSPWIASLLIANLSFLAALVLLWRWASLRWDRQVALRTLILVTVFPFSFFLAAPYAESLFLALAVATFLLAEEERWMFAACAAGLSTITRPVGAAVVLGLVVFALYRSNRRAALLSCTAILPLFAYMLYLALSFGRPFGFLTYHSAGWVPPHGGIVSTISSQFNTGLSPFDRIDAFLAILFLISGVVVWKRIGPGYGVYVLAGVLLPLIHGLVSMERYVIVLFPVMALWSLIPTKAAQAVLFAFSVLCLVTFTTMFAVGYSIF